MSRTSASNSDVRLSIDTSDARQRWRFRCPAGHTSWEPTNFHWWCQECARSHDPDLEPEFDRLVDKKTGQVYQRDEVEIQGYRRKSQ